MKNVKSLLMGALIVGSFVACSDDDSNNDGGENPSADRRTEVYSSSNSDGNVRIFDVSSDGTISAGNSTTLVTTSLDSEGIFYSGDTDIAVQASRSNGQLNTYADVSATEDGVAITVQASSSADLESPRDIAVSANGTTYVVADNADVDGDPDTADGRLFVYLRTNNGFTLRNTIETNFKVWGIEFVGGDLYAVVDTTSDVALFANFESQFTQDGPAEATKRVTFEGIVRTHGLSFDGDTMILTDVGSGADDADGGFHIVNNFVAKFNATTDGGTVTAAEQVRVAGSSTFLGNPVSAAFDADSNTVFIAERANGGGRILAFSTANVEGDVAPLSNVSVAGSSSVFFYTNVR